MCLEAVSASERFKKDFSVKLFDEKFILKQPSGSDICFTTDKSEPQL